MKILVAPNALKGSLTASEAARIIIGALPTQADSFLCPIADGGNSTLECLVDATRGEYKTELVSGPLAGMKVQARWGIFGNAKTAVIEMAEAAGLHLLLPENYDPAHGTTRGVGELIARIAEEGFRKIIIGLGGSATHDCGTGCAKALGVKFLDGKGNELPDGGIFLSRLVSIETSTIHPKLCEMEITGMTDVTNPLTGPSGAAYTFSPQKGADPAVVVRLDAASKIFEEKLRAAPYMVDTNAPGMGAAGGLASSLVAFCGARLVSGVDFVLDVLEADKLLDECDLVITAEGKMDSQTIQGKGIAGIAARAKKHQKPVIAFAGRVEGDPNELCRQIGLKDLVEISPRSLPLHDAMAQSGLRLAQAVKKYFVLLGV